MIQGSLTTDLIILKNCTCLLFKFALLTKRKKFLFTNVVGLSRQMAGWVWNRTFESDISSVLGSWAGEIQKLVFRVSQGRRKIYSSWSFPLWCLVAWERQGEQVTTFERSSLPERLKRTLCLLTRGWFLVKVPSSLCGISSSDTRHDWLETHFHVHYNSGWFDEGIWKRETTHNVGHAKTCFHQIRRT